MLGFACEHVTGDFMRKPGTLGTHDSPHLLQSIAAIGRVVQKFLI